MTRNRRVLQTAVVLAAVVASWSVPCLSQTPTGEVQDQFTEPVGPEITRGEVAQPIPARRIGGRLALDLTDLAKLPVKANGRQWGKFAFSLGLIAAAGQADDSVRESLGPETQSSLAHDIRPIGQEGGLLFLGASYALGRMTDKPKAAAIGRDGLEATILAAGIVTPALKSLAGRERPRDGAGSVSFGSGVAESFPSGEVTQAFAIASVVSAHSEKKWVKGAAWLLAGATAWQRMELDAHWASDVVGGALVGASIGRWVVRRNRERSWAIEPRLEEGAIGVTVQKSF